MVVPAYLAELSRDMKFGSFPRLSELSRDMLGRAALVKLVMFFKSLSLLLALPLIRLNVVEFAFLLLPPMLF